MVTLLINNLKMDQQIEIEKIHAKIKNSSKIALIAHKNPDGDALGAVLALSEYLINIGKNPEPITIGPLDKKYLFMPNIDLIKSDFNPDQYDLIISCDNGVAIMTGLFEKYPDLFKKNSKLINIDHHPSNDYFGELNIVDTKACSTTAIIYRLLKKWNADISENMATNLLTGIYTDTGCFKHSNTNADSYRIAGALLQNGANVKLIKSSLFNSRSFSSLKVWGKVIENAYLNSENILISAITKSDLEECHASYEDLSGIGDFLSTAKEAKFAMVLAEQQRSVKGSLRTQKDVNLNKIASTFGGGGHKKAAGFNISGQLKQEVSWTIVGREE